MENFKEDLIQKLNDKNLSEGSIKLYLRNLEKLNDGNLQSFKFLNNVEKIIEKISKYKPNTQRGILISIVSVLGCCPEDKKLMKTRKKYYDLMNNKNTEIKENATDEPTDEQKENWISWEDVKKKFEELKSEVDKFKDNKRINEKESDILLCYMLLALYIYNQPRRNKDYQFMNVVKKYNDSLDDDVNYLSMEDNRFIFNNYKTSKKYGKQILDINNDLQGCINIYLKLHPKKLGKITKKTNVPFLVIDGHPLVQTNSVTKILNKIFGKKISSSALRHIFLSDKYKDVAKEMKEDAEAMAHSVGQQKEYIKNT
jgi:hypothetical protein